VNELVSSWQKQLVLLSQIAELHPQAAYSAYINGFQHKFTYFIRTIPNISNLLQPIEQTIRNKFIPAITGGHYCSDEERELFSLPVKLGGLGIRNLTDWSDIEYNNARSITEKLTTNITEQKKNFNMTKEELSTIKNEMKKARKDRNTNKLSHLRHNMSDKQRRQNDILQESASSNWLTTIPLSEFQYELNKQEFWDCLRLRYGYPIPGLPTRCPCGAEFDIQHSMSCKKGGFVTLRHNEVRDTTAKLLEEVCKNVSVVPVLLPLNGEQFANKTANSSNEARLDVSANGFWVKGQKVFIDVRVFDPNALRYNNQNLAQCYSRNKSEKKRSYNERVLHVDHGSFTPLVFNIFGGMGREAKTFYSRLSEIRQFSIVKSKFTV
jgi:hypothetical protein